MRHGFIRAAAAFALLAVLASPCGAAEEAREIVRLPSHRFAVTPSWAHAFVPRSVSHDAIGLAGEAHLGRRIGVALVGALYTPFDQPVPSAAERNTEVLATLLAEIRIALIRSERVELAVVGGPGVVSTRPLSLVDPGIREFERRAHLAFSGGAIGRVFILPELAVAIEARHVMYVQTHENAQVDEPNRRDPATWYGEQLLTNAIETRLGLAMFFSER